MNKVCAGEIQIWLKKRKLLLLSVKWGLPLNIQLKDKWNGSYLSHGPSAPTKADECVDVGGASVRSGGTMENSSVNKKNKRHH